MRVNWRRGFLRWAIVMSALSTTIPIVISLDDPRSYRGTYPDWFFRLSVDRKHAAEMARAAKIQEPARVPVRATDPDLIARLNAKKAKRVTDPDLLALLNANEPTALIDPALLAEFNAKEARQDSINAYRVATELAWESPRWNYLIVAAVPLVTFVSLMAVFYFVTGAVVLNKWVLRGFRKDGP